METKTTSERISEEKQPERSLVERLIGKQSSNGCQRVIDIDK